MTGRRGRGVADDSLPPVAGLPRSGCRCKGRNGTPKIQHHTRDAAVDDIITRLMRPGSGGYETYPCPTSDRWHVRPTRR